MQILIDAKTYELNVPVIVGVVLVSLAHALGGAAAAGYYAVALLASLDGAVARGGALVTLILTPITSLPASPPPRLSQDPHHFHLRFVVDLFRK